MRVRNWIGSCLLLGAACGAGGGLWYWKHAELERAEAAAAALPEPAESVTTARAVARESRRSTTVIGTVRARQSITVRNEVAGTVRQTQLVPGAIVDAGAVLVEFDDAVEQAELQAQRASLALAETLLSRMERASRSRAASDLDVDRARAERDVARAQIARSAALIAKKTIRAPFRARVGIADLHPGQYLHAGTELTTLQGIDEFAHVEFQVAQAVAAQLSPGQSVEVLVDGRTAAAIAAEIVALDARVDERTRNVTVRARIRLSEAASPPGASMRVRVPLGIAQPAIAVPAGALRRGPGGDHVFVVVNAGDGQLRAEERVVTVADVAGGEVLLHSGVVAGEEIAVAGGFKLRGGALLVRAAPVGVPNRS